IIGGLATYVLQRNDSLAQRKTVLVLGMVLFLMTNAAIMGYSRAAILAVSPRYGTIFLWGAALAVVVGSDFLHHVLRNKRLTSIASPVIAVGIAAVLIAHIERWPAALDEMQSWHDIRQEHINVIIPYLQNPASDWQRASTPFLPNIRQLLNDPTMVVLLPPWIQVQGKTIVPETTGTAWTVHGYDTALPPQMQSYAWGSWSDANEHTGKVVFPPITLTHPILAIPVAGYPLQGRNQLTLEVLTDPPLRLTLHQPTLGKHWQTWYVNVAQFRGQQLRLIAIDGDPQSWLAVGPPYQSSWGAWFLDRLLANLEIIWSCIAVCGVMLWLVANGLSGSQRLLPPLAVVGALLTIVIGSYISTTYIWNTLTPSAGFTSGPTHMLDLLPESFQETTTLKMIPEGLFMHADGVMETRSLHASVGMCLAIRAQVDPRASPDPLADGVDFILDVIASGQTFQHKLATVRPGQQVTMIVPVPGETAFSLRLETRQRANPNYDWAIWSLLPTIPCR
ncbi:MAG TPA: hypothetical protein VI542_31555, partial [Candidatus Tectomicrobia bacterium]